MSIPPDSFQHRFGVGLGLLLGTWTLSASAPSSPPTLAHQATSGDRLFLWLGVGCFAAALLLMLGRTLLNAIKRRSRGRALRSFRTEAGPRRAGGLLRRFNRRDVKPSPVQAGSWEARTRRAELKAQQAVAALRTELTPHLARMMKDRLVWTLMSQRARLLSMNQANFEKVATLEHRLTAIQLQIRNQAEAYESRIQELEKEISEKSTVTRELLRFRVLVARQALEAVRLDKGRGRR